jgi:hypothetical protein
LVNTKPICDSNAISLLALLSTKMEANIQLYDLLYVRNIKTGQEFYFQALKSHPTNVTYHIFLEINGMAGRGRFIMQLLTSMTQTRLTVKEIRDAEETFKCITNKKC